MKKSKRKPIKSKKNKIIKNNENELKIQELQKNIIALKNEIFALRSAIASHNKVLSEATIKLEMAGNEVHSGEFDDALCESLTKEFESIFANSKY